MTPLRNTISRADNRNSSVGIAATCCVPFSPHPGFMSRQGACLALTALVGGVYFTGRCLVKPIETTVNGN
jgi:hypothetical protein